MVSILAGVICGCGGQQKTDEKMVYNKEFDWMMIIPEGFDSMTTEEVRTIQGKGLEAMEKTYGREIEDKGGTIFAFKSGQTALFHGNWQPFDSSLGSYGEGYRALNRMIYATFETQMTGARLDSSSSIETISGLQFLVFKVRVGLGDTVLDCWYYRRLFGKKELLVNITTADKEKQKALLEAWRKSKFGSDDR
ncbi:MAG TPA: hypothetical protein VGB46_07105 [Flavisolibacter sp.]